MTFETLLKLGRVSNLPTVWTNALAGWFLAGAALDLVPFLATAIALSLFYIGGMYLNDAFDAEIDAAERANRPIPMGEISRPTVYVAGFGMLGVGIVIGFALGTMAGLAGIALAAAVVAYDWLHKHVSYGPVLMGLCRFLSVAMAAIVAGDLTSAALLGAAAVFAHTVGLTYTAKQEAYDRIGNAWPLAVMAVPVLIVAWMADHWAGWVLLAVYLGWTLRCLWFLKRRAPGDVPKAVVGLIAGIALLDAALLGAVHATGPAIIAVALFGLTIVLQRRIAGT